MYIIGLTGGIATGKTTLSTLLSQKGIIIVDADQITHEQYKRNKQLVFELEQSFPNVVSRGVINRKALSLFITLHPEKLSLLEEIAHRYILEEILKELNKKNQQNKLVVLVAPLLFESGLYRTCHAVICLSASLEEQKKRAMMRDGMTLEKFETLVNRQWITEKKEKYATFIVSTQQTVEKAFDEIFSFLNRYQ